MRLIHAKTLELCSFTDSEIPPYAILSHTWGTGEVSFQEMLTIGPEVEAKLGFEKIRKCCELALKDGLDYAWVDTCCIDKTSSAELSEAINSMYRYYGQAKVCYAILSDVPAASAFSNKGSHFGSSRWFTRGWTLQELLAPGNLEFYSQEWQPIGNKRDLAKQIRMITGINLSILQGITDLQSFSIARRMSWAAGRNTTRTEDIAYSLMGIFDINMPMLYGEGEKAFTRLQEEIVKTTEDQSIFCWEDPSAAKEALCGLLAPHPRCFSTTGGFHSFVTPDSDCGLVTVTNRGISIDTRHYNTKSGLTAMLECVEHNQVGSFAFIHLLPLGEIGSRFARIRANKVERAPRRGTIRPTIVKQNPKPLKPAETLQGEQWFTISSITFPPRIVMGAEKLDFFTVSEHSAIRSLQKRKSVTQDAQQTDQRQIRIRDPPSNYLFRLPDQPNQVAVTLHITAQDGTGFPFWHHAQIKIGTHAGSDFAITATSLGEGDEEYVEEAKNTNAEEEFSNPKPFPATVGFEMENAMKVNASLAWQDMGGEMIACISLEVLDDK